jgi:hypothetical protein
MAVTGLVAVETLPRFLLPRLSWTAPLSASRPAAARPFAAYPARPSIRSAIPAFNAAFADRRHGNGQTPALRRGFHATSQRHREHHFDTLKFVKQLEGEGFTEEQSVAMMKVLNDVIQERFVLTQITHGLSIQLFFFPPKQRG